MATPDRKSRKKKMTSLTCTRFLGRLSGTHFLGRLPVCLRFLPIYSGFFAILAEKKISVFLSVHFLQALILKTNYELSLFP